MAAMRVVLKTTSKWPSTFVGAEGDELATEGFWNLEAAALGADAAELLNAPDEVVGSVREGFGGLAVAPGT
jgi:hypothetical protein